MESHMTETERPTKGAAKCRRDHVCELLTGAVLRLLAAKAGRGIAEIGDVCPQPGQGQNQAIQNLEPSVRR
jgi:hypothetical protein